MYLFSQSIHYNSIEIQLNLIILSCLWIYTTYEGVSTNTLLFDKNFQILMTGVLKPGWPGLSHHAYIISYKIFHSITAGYLLKVITVIIEYYNLNILWCDITAQTGVSIITARQSKQNLWKIACTLQEYPLQLWYISQKYTSS